MKQDDVLRQFRIWRNWGISGLKEIPDPFVAAIPKGFSNNIHWNAGHVLVAWDHGIYPSLGLERQLPVEFHTSFSNGSRPAEWTSDPPKLATIIQALEEQKEEIVEFCQDKLDKPLKEPFIGISTLGEMFTFLLIHEHHHMGLVKGLINTQKSQVQS